MKKILLTFTIFLGSNVHAGGLPVYDGLRHVTDLLDNIQDILDQINQIKNQMEQIEKLEEQISQMDDYLKRVGNAASVAINTSQLNTQDLKDILREIDEYKNGAGLTEIEKKVNVELFGDIDKKLHTKVDEPEAEKKYAIFEIIEKEYAAFKKTSESISDKRLAILKELENLGGQLNSAATDQEVQKINSAINAHHTALAAIKDEEERQYKAFSAELQRHQTAMEKEIRRFEERAKMLDTVNRHKQQIFKLIKSSEILKEIEGK